VNWRLSASQRGEVEGLHKELIADAAEEAFDFSFGGGIADGGVTQYASDAGADECDFLGAVDGSVVDEELLRHAAFVEGGAEGFYECVDVLIEEELAMTEDAAGVVEEGDEFGGLLRSGGRGAVWSEQGVGLPELVGVFHAEGESLFLIGVVFGEQIVFADEAVKGGLGDAVGVEQSRLDAESVDGAFVGVQAAEVGLGGLDGFEEFLGRDFAGVAFVFTRLGRHAGDAAVLVAVEPGLDGAPGELPRVAVFVGESHGGDGVHAFVAGLPGDGVDGAEDAHLQVDGRQFVRRDRHGVPVGASPTRQV
jgi:hypothetical protein